jgi:hypothetical protein
MVDKNDTENNGANTPDLIAAKFTVYEEVLRMLVRAAPNSAEIKNEIDLTIEHWRQTMPDDRYLAQVAKDTRDSIFAVESKPEQPQSED